MQTYGSAIGRLSSGSTQPRRFLGRIDAQDVAGRAVQPDMAEIGRLVDAVLVVEEQPQAVGRVDRLRQLLLDQLLMRDEVDRG